MCGYLETDKFLRIEHEAIFCPLSSRRIFPLTSPVGNRVCIGKGKSGKSQNLKILSTSGKCQEVIQCKKKSGKIEKQIIEVSEE